MSRSIGLTPDLEAYVATANRPVHPALERCRRETLRDLPDDARMLVSAEQGAFLAMLARLVGARDAIEVGVFTGYSATATALAMQDMHGERARLVACDVSDEFMARAVLTFESAGVADVIEPRVGPAVDSLDQLLDHGEGMRFDLAFVDADKPGYLTYYEQLVDLLRPGGVMAFDNVLWGGAVADLAKQDADTQALRAVAARAHDDARVDIAFTTIGDGLLICQKR